MDFLFSIDFDQAKQFIEDYGYFALAIALIAEMIPGLGFLVPGVSTLLLAGALAATSELNILIIIPIAIAATTTGDTISFLIGTRLPSESGKAKKWADNLRPWLHRAENNSPVLMLFKFAGPARSLFPATLGWLGMSLRKWIVFDLLAGTVFVSAMATVGYVVGRTTGDIAGLGGAIAVGLFLLNIPVLVLVYQQYFGKSKSSKSSKTT